MTCKKTIYVHIGTPKTGTTTIQEYLAVNYDLLLTKGCLVPVSSRRHKSNHTLLANYCINKKTITAISIRNGIYDEKSLAKFRRDFQKSIRKEIRMFSGSHIVLSNEQCYGRLTTTKEIRKLRNLFKGLGARVRIIVYLREQSDMLCSYYSSKMKNGMTYMMESMDDFSRDGMFDYNGRLEMWEQVFGIENMIVRIYDRDRLHDNDIISDFMETIGLEKAGQVPEQLNRKLSASQCEFLRLINYHIPFYTGDRVNAIRDGLKGMVEMLDFKGPDVSALITSEYQKVYSSGNARIAKRYFDKDESIFKMKELSDTAIEQSDVLSAGDIKEMAEEMIMKFADHEEVLCRCIAAIFNVSYKGEYISMDYVDSLGMKSDAGSENDLKQTAARTWAVKLRGYIKKILSELIVAKEQSR